MTAACLSPGHTCPGAAAGHASHAPRDILQDSTGLDAAESRCSRSRFVLLSRRGVQAGEGREVTHSLRAPASFVSGTAILRAWLRPQSGWLPHTSPGTGPVIQAARRGEGQGAGKGEGEGEGAGAGAGVGSARRVCVLATEKELPRQLHSAASHPLSLATTLSHGHRQTVGGPASGEHYAP